MDWGTLIFNYGRNEVRNFLIANALFWLDEYHIDGLRVDAVASMLYLDYSRKAGEWVPNCFGGRENLDAINFLKRFNEVCYERHPGIMTIAEESTAWPGVSRPTYLGGLGFGFKWNMGWMNDFLRYISKDPIHRRYHQGDITFSMLYAFHEHFILVLSHDEVVHGKGSLIDKMPGDDWQKFANLRMFSRGCGRIPARNCIFQGSEFGQWAEWNHDRSLDWHLTQFAPHDGLAASSSTSTGSTHTSPRSSNRTTPTRASSGSTSTTPTTPSWSFMRKAAHGATMLVFVINATPVVARRLPRRRQRRRLV